MPVTALATGAGALLKADNRYGASALIRQLVEVEYLADAFAADDEVAAQWLRAERQERLDFWSPGKLRQRAEGRFLNTDYWHHCEFGGHPAKPGMALLPGHKRPNVAYLWVDMAAHLTGIWRSSAKTAVQLLGFAPELPDVDAAIENWQATDGLRAVVGDLSRILRDDPEALSKYDHAASEARPSA